MTEGVGDDETERGLNGNGGRVRSEVNGYISPMACERYFGAFDGGEEDGWLNQSD